MATVKCGNFVKRQTETSGFSHFDGTWEQLENLAGLRLNAEHGIKNGYRDGVILLDMPSKWFYSAIVDLDSTTKLIANYAPRREGEAPFLRVSAKAKKQKAKHALIVLYRSDVLAENNERETDADWEIVAIKARASDEEEPMDPYTMARNFLHLKGGTKGTFSAEDFAKSIVYWNSHVMTSGSQPWYKRCLSLIKGK